MGFLKHIYFLDLFVQRKNTLMITNFLLINIKLNQAHNAFRNIIFWWLAIQVEYFDRLQAYIYGISKYCNGVALLT